MIYALAARTNSKILDVRHAADEPARDHAIDLLTTRFKPHRLATDRILGLPDGIITTLTRTQVETMVAALPRNCTPHLQPCCPNQLRSTSLLVDRFSCLAGQFAGSYHIVCAAGIFEYEPHIRPIDLVVGKRLRRE